MKKEIFIIFLVALIARVLYLGLGVTRQNADDTIQWKKMAHYFAEGKGFLTEAEDLDPKRPPIYPLFLAAHFHFFGEESDIPVQITQIILSSLSCVLLYLIASVLLSQKIGFWSGIFLALYPPVIIYSAILQSETLFTFLLLLFLFLWTFAWGLTPIIPGVALGILSLCRGTMLFFSIFLVVASLLFSQTRKDLQKILLMIGISLLVIAPWSWRNSKVYNMFIPIVSGGPELLWFGTLPIESQKKYGNSQEYLQIKDKIPTSLKESEKFYMNLALKNISQAPFSYLSLTIKKFAYFWLKPVGHELVENQFPSIGILLLLCHFTLIALVAHGLILSRSHFNALLPIYMLITYFALFHTALVPMPRFRLPMEPLLLIFSATSLYRLIKNKT